MRFPLKCVILVLPLLLAACEHKQQRAQLPPLAPPDVAKIPPPPNAPPPVAETIPTKPTVEAPTPPQPAPKPVAKKKKPKPADTTEQAANPNPEVSAIGQLSSGDPVEFRHQTDDAIASVEQGLKNINRTLDEVEQKTADHIREYIKEAKAAEASGDVDGAHNLAAKARVLLNELANK